MVQGAVSDLFRLLYDLRGGLCFPGNILNSCNCCGHLKWSPVWCIAHTLEYINTANNFLMIWVSVSDWSGILLLRLVLLFNYWPIHHTGQTITQLVWYYPGLLYMYHEKGQTKKNNICSILRLIITLLNHHHSVKFQSAQKHQPTNSLSILPWQIASDGSVWFLLPNCPTHQLTLSLLYLKEKLWNCSTNWRNLPGLRDEFPALLMNFQLTFSVQFSQFNEGDSSLESELEIWCPRVRLVMGGEIAFISFEIWLVLSEWRHLHVPCRETFIYFAELCGNITHTAQHLSYHQTPVRTKRIFLTVHTVRVCTVLFCTVLYCTVQAPDCWTAAAHQERSMQTADSSCGHLGAGLGWAA